MDGHLATVPSHSGRCRGTSLLQGSLHRLLVLKDSPSNTLVVGFSVQIGGRAWLFVLFQKPALTFLVAFKSVERTSSSSKVASSVRTAGVPAPHSRSPVALPKPLVWIWSPPFERYTFVLCLLVAFPSTQGKLASRCFYF